MARKKADLTDEQRIREHAAKLGFDPAVIEKIVALLLKFVALIPLFLAKKPARKAVFADLSPKATTALVLALKEDLVDGLQEGQADPGKFAGPLTRSLMASAFNSLLDLAKSHVDAAVNAIDAAINTVIATP